MMSSLTRKRGNPLQRDHVTRDLLIVLASLGEKLKLFDSELSPEQLKFEAGAGKRVTKIKTPFFASASLLMCE